MLGPTIQLDCLSIFLSWLLSGQCTCIISNFVVAVLLTKSSRSGYDAPFHMSEECANANVASPRAIVMTSGFGGLFGWFLQLVTAYTVIDIDLVLGSDLGQPLAAYLLQVMPEKTALAILGLTCLRLQHGPRMYGGSQSSHLCVRP
jgi:amino acid transporter